MYYMELFNVYIYLNMYNMNRLYDELTIMKRYVPQLLTLTLVQVVLTQEWEVATLIIVPSTQFYSPIKNCLVDNTGVYIYQEIFPWDTNRQHTYITQKMFF